MDGVSCAEHRGGWPHASACVMMLIPGPESQQVLSKYLGMWTHTGGSNAGVQVPAPRFPKEQATWDRGFEPQRLYPQSWESEAPPVSADPTARDEDGRVTRVGAKPELLLCQGGTAAPPAPRPPKLFSRARLGPQAGLTF